MIRFLKGLVLLPVAVVVILFAVANREPVRLSLDPFSQVPAFSASVPLYALVAFVKDAAATEAALQRVTRGGAQELADEGRRGAHFLVTITTDSAGYLSVTTFARVTLEMTAAVVATMQSTLAAGLHTARS